MVLLVRMMTRKPSSCFFFLYKTRRRATATCTAQVDPPANIASLLQSTSSDHKLFCFSLAEELIKRGSISSAWHLIQRMIANSASVSDAVSAADFAIVRGMDLDLGSYGVLIRKLIESGEPKLAFSLYEHHIVAFGIDPSPTILNSIVVCLCKLGNLEDAKRHFDQLLSMNCSPCKSACVGILRGLFEEKGFLEAFDYFIKIVDAGVHLDGWSYNFLIDGLCCQGYIDEAMEVVDMMSKRKGLPPTLHQYKSLFYGLCKRGRVLEAESFCNEMESQGFYVDRTMYTSLINGYCKYKKMKMAMRVYFKMLKMGCELDTYTCNTLIHGFFKMGLFDKGWALRNQMVDWGLQPNVVTSQIMIDNYCRQGKVDSALMILNNMAKSNLAPTVHCYTVVIAALYKENRIMEVDELYKNMLDNGVAPDHILSFVLMKYHKGQELQLALKLLQGFAKNGCGIDSLALSKSAPLYPSGVLSQEIELLLGEILKSNSDLANVAFAIYISALCKGGKGVDAFLCLNKMVTFGCKPLLFTCNSLIKCHCEEGFLEEANSVIELMQDYGMVPDVETYLVMLTEFCKRGKLDSAFDILDQMEVRGPRPNVAIYDTIIGCLCREKRIHEACDVFKRMLEAGIDPDEVVYATMISGYCQNGKTIEACVLFEEMIENSVQPSSYVYTALISGLVKKGMMDKGSEYLDRMLGDGIVPNVVLYTSLINHFLWKGDFEFAFRLVDLMDRSRVDCDVITYTALVSGVCRHIAGRKRLCVVNKGSESAREMLFQLLHQKTLLRLLPRENDIRVSADSPEQVKFFVLKLVQKVKEIQLMPNLYLYNGIISGFCGVGKMHDAYDHFQLMQREGVHPNQVTFTILINGHIIAGEIDHAIRLFNKMNADGWAPDRIAYITLLKGLRQTGRLWDALSVLYAMHKRGFVPNRATYENLLGCLCANRWAIPAFKLFEEMIAYDYLPRPFICHLLFHILCKEKQFHEAGTVLDMMLQRGRVPHDSTKRLLVEYFRG